MKLLHKHILNCYVVSGTRNDINVINATKFQFAQKQFVGARFIWSRALIHVLFECIYE